MSNSKDIGDHHLMNKKKCYIGIDPDVHKNGVSLLVDGKFIELLCLDLMDTTTYIDMTSVQYPDRQLVVKLEAGWLLKSSWHRGGHGMAKRVGANHEVGRQIEKFCKKKGVTCDLIKPAGYSDYSHAHFCRLTGWNPDVKTNSEKRVAGMLVWGMR